MRSFFENRRLLTVGIGGACGEKDLYKAEDLCGLSVKPKINDIDWNVLQDYYRKFLNPFIYQYDIAEDEKQSSIQLRFDEENFCHLLGIESIVKYSVSKKLLIGFIV